MKIVGERTLRQFRRDSLRLFHYSLVETGKVGIEEVVYLHLDSRMTVGFFLTTINDETSFAIQYDGGSTEREFVENYFIQELKEFVEQKRKMKNLLNDHTYRVEENHKKKTAKERFITPFMLSMMAAGTTIAYLGNLPFAVGFIGMTLITELGKPIVTELYIKRKYKLKK